MGARAVQIGRPLAWGLVVDGKDGISDVLSFLRDDLTMLARLSQARPSVSRTARCLTLLGAAHRPIDRVPMRGDLLQAAGCRESCGLQTLDYRFDLRHACLKSLNLAPDGIQLLRE
jgi:FMN-dependent dehydrogenase